MSEIIKQEDTRRAFIEALNELAEKDPKIIVIICDVGFNYLDEPKNKFKVLNLGVTEVSSTIIASALALSGFKPYLYSMINFVTFRSHEAIRNAICLHDANVKIIGVKGSEGYKFLGFSHNILREDEEIDFLKKMPRMNCYLPKKNDEVKQAVLESYKNKGPAYIIL
jgi:transketolase